MPDKTTYRRIQWRCGAVRIECCPMSITILENQHLRVGVTTQFGARVVSLFDKASGREWMTQGTESTNTGEAAVYGGPEAVGWDECFPTVGASDASSTGWQRRLRDH
eukprot:gene62854-85963_t